MDELKLDIEDYTILQALQRIKDLKMTVNGDGTVGADYINNKGENNVKESEE